MSGTPTPYTTLHPKPTLPSAISSMAKPKLGSLEKETTLCSSRMISCSFRSVQEFRFPRSGEKRKRAGRGGAEGGGGGVRLKVIGCNVDDVHCHAQQVKLSAGAQCPKAFRLVCGKVTRDEMGPPPSSPKPRAVDTYHKQNYECTPSARPRVA